MKGIFTVFICIMLCLSLSACGGEDKKEAVEPAKVEQPQSTQTAPAAKPSEAKSVLSTNYEAYNDAKSAYEKYVLAQSKEHEIVSVSQSLAIVNELKILNYLMPLSFLEQSVEKMGKYDQNSEVDMLNAGWADNVTVTENGEGSYVVTGDLKTGKYKIDVKYDRAADSLRLEGYKNEDKALVFEYINNAGGYAAQYYYKTVTGSDKGKPIEGFCTYKIIFKGENGSCARFDDVNAEPASIIGQSIAAESFISGAAHWFTIKDGEFTGQLGGKGF